MSFMEPDVQFGDWIEVDSGAGTTFIPADVVGTIPAREQFTDDDDGETAYTCALALAVRDYVESSKIFSVTERKGWGARLSAPGYMDCTDWSVFDTEAEAREYLNGLLDDEFPDDGEYDRGEFDK